MHAPEENLYIYGRHAVEEALCALRPILSRVLIAPGRKDDGLRKMVEAAKVSVSPLEIGKLTKAIDKDAVHQGVVGIIPIRKLMQSYKDFASLLQVTPHTSLVLLGEVQDPHNVGAIIRSAAAFGVSGVLIPEHNQAQVTASVIKVSAGMAFKIPLVTIGNVNTVARDLKEKGFWIYGLDGDAKVSVTEERYDNPSVFILGNEGRGLREKTRELCDILLSIPMHGRCESLNVSVSAAVALFAWSSQHAPALTQKD